MLNLLEQLSGKTADEEKCRWTIEFKNGSSPYGGVYVECVSENCEGECRFCLELEIDPSDINRNPRVTALDCTCAPAPDAEVSLLAVRRRVSPPPESCELQVIPVGSPTRTENGMVRTRFCFTCTNEGCTGRCRLLVTPDDENRLKGISCECEDEEQAAS